MNLPDDLGVTLMEHLDLPNRQWNLGRFSTPQEALDALGVQEPSLRVLVREQASQALTGRTDALLRELVEQVRAGFPRERVARWEGKVPL